MDTCCGVNADAARQHLHHILSRNSLYPDAHVASEMEDLIRREPFASVADDTDAHLYIRAVRVYDERVVGDDDIPALFYILKMWSEFEDNKRQVKDIFHTMLTQDNGLSLLEELVCYAKSDPSIVKDTFCKNNDDVIFWIQCFIHKLLFDPCKRWKTTPRFVIDDFARFFPLIADYGAGPFTPRHVEMWLDLCIQGPVTRGDLDRLLRVAPVDFRQMNTITGNTPRMLLEACRDHWSDEEDEDTSRRYTSWLTNPNYKDRIGCICYSLRYMKDVGDDHPIWDVIASHTEVYSRFAPHIEEDRRRVREARRRWCRARFRVAVRAVSAGALMWRLYQTWSLHPERLALAASALSTVTARTRQVMACEASSAVAPPIGSEFRLMDVVAYLYDW